MKTKEIDLGYVSMYDYASDTPLNPEWHTPGHEFYEVGDEKKNVDEKEVVLKTGTYTLVISYPLSTPFKKSFVVGVKGMTRRALVNLTVKCYKKIYADENKAVGDPVPYGIWGHDLGDLMLHTASVNKKTISVRCDS